LGNAERASTTYERFARDVKPGDRILLADGAVELRAIQSDGVCVRFEAICGGPVGSHKGINLPGVQVSSPSLTEKDLSDLEFGLSAGVDLIALSFVRTAADVAMLRERLGRRPARIVAKIEKPAAWDHIDEILEEADGVMVARGDLGVELSTEEVPTLQKRIIEMANGAGKAVITATQMLESMIESPRPTRAEASDVANAILDGTDAVMLSAETAAGRYPVEAVETMARIARYTEVHYGFRAPARVTGGMASMVARSLARVASTVAEELDCRLIVAFTESGSTAKLLSAFRPRATVAGISPNETTCRQLALWWGVVPVKSEFAATTDEMIVRGEELLKQKGLATSGSRVVMLAGQKNTPGATNMLRVHSIS
jgi:pyruvate kinase